MSLKVIVNGSLVLKLINPTNLVSIEPTPVELPTLPVKSNSPVQFTEREPGPSRVLSNVISLSLTASRLTFVLRNTGELKVMPPSE